MTMDNFGGDEYEGEDLDDITDEENGEEEYMEQEDSQAVYDELATTLPPRPVFLDADDVEVHKSASEIEDDGIQKSDTQVILRELSPRSRYSRVNDIARMGMVSRIFPDNLLDKQKLSVYGLMIEYDEYDNIPFIDLMMNIQDMLSIGYNGMGRVEYLDMAGVSREEDLERQVRDMMG